MVMRYIFFYYCLQLKLCVLGFVYVHLLGATNLISNRTLCTHRESVFCQQRLNKRALYRRRLPNFSNIYVGRNSTQHHDLKKKNSSGFFGSIIEFICFFASLFTHASLFFSWIVYDLKEINTASKRPEWERKKINISQKPRVLQSKTVVAFFCS